MKIQFLNVTEEKSARYTLRYKGCEECKQSKRLSTFVHGGDLCIQCLRYLNDPSRQFPDLNRKLFDQNLPSILEGLQKSAEAAQISHHEILQHLTQLTTRVSNLESLETRVTEPSMESKDSERESIRKLMADTVAESEIWKQKALTLETQLSSTQEKIKILEQHALVQQQILDQKALELEKLTRESNQVVMERDNLREKCETQEAAARLASESRHAKQEAEIQSQRAESVAEIQRLKAELQHQEQKYITEIRHLEKQIREPQVRMTPSTVGASSSEASSSSLPRYEMSPSQGYGPLVAERRLVYEPRTPASPIAALAAWVPAGTPTPHSSDREPAVDPTARPLQREREPPGSAESRTTPRKPPSIKFRSPGPQKA